jgi:hypothetical protein
MAQVKKMFEFVLTQQTESGEKMIMKKKNGTKNLVAALALATVAMFGAPTVSAADIVAGDLIKLGNGPGNGPGGEFIASFLDNTGSFSTFCLEYNQYFSYGESLKVQAVNTAAVSGGISGGNPDPISYQTAWLYTQFRGGSLSDYGGANIINDADSLQNAFWYLEGEVTTLGSNPSGTDLTVAELAQAQTWINQANAAVAGGWNSIGDVRVLNLMRKDDQGNYTVKAQDQLYLITPVPEPEIYAMMGLGLGLMGFVARRRKQNGTAT